MDRIVIYKRDCTEKTAPPNSLNNEYNVSVWKPGLVRFSPPMKPIKYLLYWIFHYLGLFGNRAYSAILVTKSDRIIASMMIVPSHFKWPFMAKEDLQLTYVLTNPEFRGKGIGELMLRTAINGFSKENRIFWYVTDTGNSASIRLCTRLGFEFFSFAQPSGIFKTLKAIR